MRNLFTCLFLLLLMLAGVTAKAQYRFLTEAPADERVKALWRYCSDRFISDKDSAAACRFLDGAVLTADSLGDAQLKKYVIYFRMCYRILFSQWYEQHFPEGGYASVLSVFEKTKAWAQKEGYADIVASCMHFTGQVYFRVGRNGPAFEHLLKAHEAFQKIGYENVPNAAGYLYYTGLSYYRFEEWDKALEVLLAATRYTFYVPRNEISTYNTIGLIYDRKKEWDKATLFYHKTIVKAIGYNDSAWIGIASGNLGNVFLAEGQNDSSLFYHRKNYYINISTRAPEDAAKSALAIAMALIRKQQPDSVLHYISSGRELANENIRDPAERLEYQRRLLVVMIELNKAKGDYKTALLLSDSLIRIKDSLQQKLDNKILNRAVEKTEAERYGAELKLMESQKSLSRLRFYMLIAVLFCIMITAALLFNRYRVRKLRQAQLAEKEKELLLVEKLRTEEKLKHAEELLTAYLTTIKEKTALIEDLDAELQRLKETASHALDLQGMAANREKLVSGTILTDDDWAHFRSLFEQVHPGFLYRLKEKFPALSPAEIRLLILTKLNLSGREMAHMLGISSDAIRKSRYRLRKKLNLEEESNLEALIQLI